MPSCLRRRGHTWFLRWKWPSRLAAFGFSGELIRSLRTSDFRIARRRALTIVLQIETMTEAKQLPKRAELESDIRRWIDDSVWRQEIKRAETGHPTIGSIYNSAFGTTFSAVAAGMKTFFPDLPLNSGFYRC